MAYMSTPSRLYLSKKVVIEEAKFIWAEAVDTKSEKYIDPVPVCKLIRSWPYSRGRSNTDVAISLQPPIVIMAFEPF